MTDPVYAERRHLYKLGGLPRGQLGMQGRVVASVTVATDLIELDGHGFETGDEVIPSAPAGTLPAPLVVGTTVYAIRVSESFLKLSATSGGAAIDLTTAGTNLRLAAPLPIDETLEFYSRWVDGLLAGHQVPLQAVGGEFPLVITGVVAQLAAKRLLQMSGQSSIAMDQVELAAKAQVERWAAATPVRDSRASVSANLAVVRTGSNGGASDPRGWGDTIP